MFNEQLLPIQWLGAAAVLSGIYMINRSNDPVKAPELVEN
jgi:hypothetical protein